MKICGISVLFLGAGGAARAIAFSLAQRAKPGELAFLDIKALLRELRADLGAVVRAEPLTPTPR